MTNILKRLSTLVVPNHNHRQNEEDLVPDTQHTPDYYPSNYSNHDGAIEYPDFERSEYGGEFEGQGDEDYSASVNNGASSFYYQHNSGGQHDRRGGPTSRYTPSFMTSIAASATDHDPEKEDGVDRFALMASHLFSVAETNGWFPSGSTGHSSLSGGGVVSVRKGRRDFVTFPRATPQLAARDMLLYEDLTTFENAVSTLNPEVAIRVGGKVVRGVLSQISHNATDVVIDIDTRIQVIDELAHLAGARKHQFAAFVRNEKTLVVWSDQVEDLLEQVDILEKKMIQFVWSSRNRKPTGILKASASQSSLALGGSESGSVITNSLSYQNGLNVSLNGVELSSNGYGGDDLHMINEDNEIDETKKEGSLDGDIESEAVDWEGGPRGPWTIKSRRPVMLFAPLITGMAIILNVVFVGSGIRSLIRECVLDGTYYRLALLATTPFTFLLAMFFCICVIGNLWQGFGPIAHCHENSSYYSGKPPRRLVGGRLPHFTIQMPVYKEGLEAVIVPTIESLKKAITTYERQGGSVNILICEDGMQLWSEADAEVRKAYYDRNAIGWVARPKHGYNGFIRKGRFKKASNMNFACALSLRVEELMDEIRPVPELEDEYDEEWLWTEDDELEIYEEALERALEESQGIAQAAGNIRIGEYILIIDSDTRVPEDCFLDAASELEASKDIAIIQHESDVMYVVGHYFENGIAHFTRRINKAISFCCANGEVAPFVGHNAFLRWSACQDAAFIDPDDGLKKIWSESHVSEDFDMSLRLQMRGYSLRWATYSNGGFKEGVSLTCDDELNRWQKYAYGCSELLFQPFKRWLFKGPITPLFHTFVWSDIPLHSKISVLAYISSYYAISIASLMSTANWILVGLWDNLLDNFYLQSWQVFLTCIFVFCFLSNFCASIFLYRLKEATLGGALMDNFKWLLFFFFFFSGMSWHLQVALVAHLISYNIQWGATVKEVEVSNFFSEVPAILKRFWRVYLWGFLNIFAIILMATDVLPAGYRITAMVAILPTAVQAACHILYPIALNPWLMHFQF